MTTEEAVRRLGNRDKVAQLFRDRSEVWLDSRLLEQVGGRCAWRTRISELRTQMGMVIENRQRRIMLEDGTVAVCSEYRYVPAREPAPSIVGQLSMFASRRGTL